MCQLQKKRSMLCKELIAGWNGTNISDMLLSVSGLQHLHCCNLVDGFNVDETSELVDCKTCVQVKQHRAPFPQTAERCSTYPGEVTHVNLWGPAHFTATNGSRYYMSVIHWWLFTSLHTETFDEKVRRTSTDERLPSMGWLSGKFHELSWLTMERNLSTMISMNGSTVMESNWTHPHHILHSKMV